jgi:hypothetical protein
MHKGVAMAVPRTLERRTKMHKDVERTLGLPRRDSSRRPWLRRRCAAGQPIMAAAAFQAALSFAQLPTYFVEAPPVSPGRFRCGRLGHRTFEFPLPNSLQRVTSNLPALFDLGEIRSGKPLPRGRGSVSD